MSNHLIVFQVKTSKEQQWCSLCWRNLTKRQFNPLYFAQNSKDVKNGPDTFPVRTCPLVFWFDLIFWFDSYGVKSSGVCLCKTICFREVLIAPFNPFKYPSVYVWCQVDPWKILSCFDPGQVYTDYLRYTLFMIGSCKLISLQTGPNFTKSKEHLVPQKVLEPSTRPPPPLALDALGQRISTTKLFIFNIFVFKVLTVLCTFNFAFG